MKKIFFQYLPALAIVLVIVSISIYLFEANHNTSTADDFEAAIDFVKEQKVLVQGEEYIADLPYNFAMEKFGTAVHVIDATKIGDLNGKVIEFISAYGRVVVAVDGETVFDYTPKSQKKLKSEGYQRLFVDLVPVVESSEAKMAKEITISYTSTVEIFDKHRIDGARVGEKVSIINMHIKEEGLFLIFNAMIITVGLLLWISGFFTGRKGKPKTVVGSTGAIALLIGSYLCLKTWTLHYFVSNPTFLYVTEYLVLAMIPLPFVFLAINHLDRRLRFLHILSMGSTLLNLFIQSISLLLGIFEPRQILALTHINIVIVTICIVIIFFFTDSKKYTSKNIILISMLPMLISAVVGVVSYNLITSISFVEVLTFGTIIFVGIQIHYVVGEYIKYRQSFILEGFYKKIAMEDMLTGLGSRMAYNQKIDYLSNNRDRIQTLLIVSIDISGLKDINNNYSHIEGDKILEYMGKSLKEVSEKFNASAYRVGGDEFIIFAVDRPATDSKKIIKELRIEADNYPHPHIKLSFGAGIEYVIVDNNTDISSLLNSVGVKMYQDKNTHYISRAGG